MADEPTCKHDWRLKWLWRNKGYEVQCELCGVFGVAADLNAQTNALRAELLERDHRRCGNCRYGGKYCRYVTEAFDCGYYRMDDNHFCGWWEAED